MNRIKIFLLLFSISVQVSFACTSIIVSGKASTDGRPYIFKNTDATKQDEVVVSCKGEIYHYIAITLADDFRPDKVSSGFNEKGFSIINTKTFNQNGARKDDSNNTRIMRRALEICASLKDFECLLDTLPHPLRANSNFGVMDAEGCVAYYEVSNHKYKKYDVNDPMIAPHGYLIRSNFAFSGDRSKDVGVARYNAMDTYVSRMMKNGKISSEDIIRGVTRYFVHGETKVNLNEFEPLNNRKPVYVDFTDYIPRRQTISAQLIQGVEKGEDPLHTIGWTICGNPMTTVCIPLWIIPNHRVPKIMSRNSSKHASICDAGLKLKRFLFPNDKKRNKGDINLAQLINKSGTGTVQQITSIETEVFRRAKKVQNAVRKQRNAAQEINDFYSWVDSYVAAEYKKRFGIILE